MNETILDDFEVPDTNCVFNYLLDTVAFNRLAEHRAWIDLAEKSLELGFHYYKTANQDYELSGRGAKTYDANCVPHVIISESFKAKMLIFAEIMKRLRVKRVSSVASFMKNHWILDGTYRLLGNNSVPEVGMMTQEILWPDNGEKAIKPFGQRYDAMTAEAAMYHGCFLVTDDKELGEIVNKYFPERAIRTQELVDIIQEQIKRLR